MQIHFHPGCPWTCTSFIISRNTKLCFSRGGIISAMLCYGFMTNPPFYKLCLRLLWTHKVRAALLIWPVQCKNKNRKSIGKVNHLCACLNVREATVPHSVLQADDSHVCMFARCLFVCWLHVMRCCSAATLTHPPSRQGNQGANVFGIRRPLASSAIPGANVVYNNKRLTAFTEAPHLPHP